MIRIAAALAIVILSITLIYGQPETIDTLAVKTQIFTAANGMRVVLMPDASASEISVEFWLKVGTRDEEVGKYGLAHFFEHATPYGLKSDEGARTKFRSFLTNSNAQTQKDYIRYYLQVRPEGLTLAFRYVAERMSADPESITTAVVEGHRKNVLNEMNRQEANPFYGPTAWTARDAATFGKMNPYGHGAYGSFKENESFSAEDLEAWYRKYFHPENIILFVAGNFEPSAITPLINSVFAKIPGRKGADEIKRRLMRFSSGEMIVKAPTPKHHISLVWWIAERDDIKSDAVEILSILLDQRLQSVAGLVAEAGSSNVFARFQLADRFGLYANFDSLPDRERVEKLLLDSLKDIAMLGVTNSELEAAKQILIRDVRTKRNKLGFIESRTELVGEGLLFRNDPEFFLKRLRRQQKMSLSDIKDAAQGLDRRKPGKLLVLSSSNCNDPGLCGH